MSAGVDLYAPNMYLIYHCYTNALEPCASTVETLIRSEHSMQVEEAAYCSRLRYQMIPHFGYWNTWRISTANRRSALRCRLNWSTQHFSLEGKERTAITPKRSSSCRTNQLDSDTVLSFDPASPVAMATTFTVVQLDQFDRRDPIKRQDLIARSLRNQLFGLANNVQDATKCRVGDVDWQRLFVE